ncbi:sigma-54-dependent transcriptional regulator [Schlesneria paludicola]|uniref:sigma-54-dependent transcriptional regulator n=1 Tax=Schlesneria paludicola TaxID=360056 RepID=UPI00029B3DFD|nr:sigma-54 dependent transcriptional regulator [Schlesneria paludicola]
MESLLVIDDEVGICKTIQNILQSDILRVLIASTAAEGLRLLREEMPHVVLLDIRLGKMSGLDLFKQVHEVDPKALVIFITGHGTADTAIEAMKIGAYDYLVKPLDFEQLQQVVDQALKIGRLMHAAAAIDDTSLADDSSDRLVGNGPSMQSICKQIGRIAPQNVNVLVLGESGTGKELVARALYQHSRRNQAAFLAINCAAIPENLLESELFGHEQGAFTGADRRRIGKFEQCHHGTLFLDEVGDMPLATQAKILRLLQDGQFQRVGGNETLSVDVRVIAATNQNLESMIEDGRFRRDLYYRLRGVTLHLPSLRERLDDIPELAHYFLFRFNRQLGTAVQSISQDALDKLQHYRWPGNIRELQSVIREALIVSTGPTLLPEFLSIELHSDGPVEVETTEPIVSVNQNAWKTLGDFVEQEMTQSSVDIYRRALIHFDRIIVGQAMKLSGGLQSRAAEILGLSRPTLRAKIRTMMSGPQQPDPN